MSTLLPIFRGVNSTGEEKEGYLVAAEKDIAFIIPRHSFASFSPNANTIEAECHQVSPDSLRQCTGFCDEDGKMLFTGDTVEFFGLTGTVTSEFGALGISFQEHINWDKIAAAIPEYTGCDNRLYACQNDNFISFWEIAWNFNLETEEADLPFVTLSNEK